MKEFFGLFLGELSPLHFLVFLAYAYIGAVINMSIDVLERKPESPTSPKKFRWGYWRRDNWKRVFIVLVLIPISILVCDQIIGMTVEKGTALLIGLSNDVLIKLYKKKKLKAPDMEDYKND